MPWIPILLEGGLIGRISCHGSVQDVYHVSIKLVTITPIIVQKAKCQPLVVHNCGDNGLNDDDDLSHEEGGDRCLNNSTWPIWDIK